MHNFQPRQYQTDAVDSIFTWFNAQTGNPLVVAPTGCHAEGTQIMMSTGRSRSVEYIRPGDTVMGPDSLPRLVLNLCRGRQEMYRITCKDGESFVVNKDHVLNLYRTMDGTKFQGTYTNITVGEYLTKSNTFKHIHKMHRTDIQLPHTEQPMDPYILGLMLGDGCCNQLTPLFTKPKCGASDAICQYAEALGCKVTIKEKRGCCSFSITDPRCAGRRKEENAFRKQMKESGIYGMVAENKCIPHAYKYTAKYARWLVLAGLLDTDGHTDKKKCFDYISKSKQLSKDVQWVARSLGLSATFTACEKSCQTGARGTYYRVCISGDTHLIPTLDKVCTERKQKKNPLVSGFKVESIGEGDFYGFTLSGDHLYLTDDFYVHHNSGKSHILSLFIKQALAAFPLTRFCLLSHVKELLQQDAEKIIMHNPGVNLGFLSAGLGRKQFSQKVLVAGIQTAHKHADKVGHVDLVLVDEAHLISDKDDSMYRSFLGDLMRINPCVKVIGLTATPYRLGSGLLYGKDYSYFHGICYEIPISLLIEQGHLCRVTGRRGVTHVDLSTVHTRGGEYVEKELQQAFDQDPITEAIVGEVVPAAEHSAGVLIFSSGVNHAHHLAEAIRHATGERVEVISGKSNKKEREQIIADYKARKFRWLINYGVLTTGFDAPHIDLLVLCRATKSTGLYVQIIGRGMRVSPGKDKCVVLDYGGNIERHGPIDKIQPRDLKKGNGEGEAPIKECPECMALLATAVRECPDCGYEFPPPEPALEQTASDAAIMSDEKHIDRYEVDKVTYHTHVKMSTGQKSMRVEYWCGLRLFCEWVCFEHRGYARRKAENWARSRGVVAPDTVEEAVTIDWPQVAAIHVDTAGKHPEIVKVELDYSQTEPKQSDWTVEQQQEAEAFL